MDSSRIVPATRTKFYRVKCPGCGNEQTVFSAASTKIRCVACNTALGETTASRARIKAKILKEFE